MAAGNSPQVARVRFGLFELDLATGRLCKEGQTVRLQDLPLRVLTSLLETPGELVTHEILRERLWGQTIVDYEDGLHTAVCKLREALGDSAANPRFVVTVARRGYRFIAPLLPADGDMNLRSRSRTFPTRPLLGAFVLMTVLALGFMFLWLRSRSARIGAEQVGRTSLDAIPVTSYPGLERSPSLSPDGRRVAFAWNGDNADNLDIYVQNIEGGPPIRLTTDPAADDFPAWSPDGGRIAFLRGGAVYLIPSIGGHEVRLTNAVGQGLAWSPDGSLLAICSQDSESEPTGIFVVSVETGLRRKLTTPSSVTRDGLPAISPDGKEVAFVRRRTTTSDVFLVALAGGPARQLTNIGQPISGIAWTPDSQFVVFGGTEGLFKVPVRSRTPQSPVHLAVSDVGAGQPAISRSTPNGPTLLIFSWYPMTYKIWGMPTGRPGSSGASPVRVASSNLGDWGPGISPDGRKIAFISHRTGVEEIWVSGADGSSPRQLTRLGRGPGVESLNWSPDGESIAFDATLQGNRDIYIIRADGAAMTRLTDLASDYAEPSWSNDGHWIYFMSDRSGARQIWKMREDGRQATQLTKGGGYRAFESPDGRSVIYTKEPSHRGLWSVPVTGGSEVSVLESVWPESWRLAGDGIYYVDFDHSAPSRYPVNRFDLKTGSVSAVAVIPMCVPQGIPALTVRRDGGFIAWTSSGERNSDLKIVPNFRW